MSDRIPPHRLPPPRGRLGHSPVIDAGVAYLIGWQRSEDEHARIRAAARRDAQRAIVLVGLWCVLIGFAAGAVIARAVA